MLAYSFPKRAFPCSVDLASYTEYDEHFSMFGELQWHEQFLKHYHFSFREVRQMEDFQKCIYMPIEITELVASDWISFHLSTNSERNQVSIEEY